MKRKSKVIDKFSDHLKEIQEIFNTVESINGSACLFQIYSSPKGNIFFDGYQLNPEEALEYRELTDKFFTDEGCNENWLFCHWHE